MAIVFNIETEDVLSAITCYCEGYCPFGNEYGQCQTKPGGKCFKSVELAVDQDGKEYPIFSYGCLPPHEMALFQCRSVLVASRSGKSIQCCDEYDNCNKNLAPMVKAQSEPSTDHLNNVALKVLISSLSICFVIFTLALILVHLKYKRKEKLSRKTNKASDEVENGGKINISNVNNILNFPNGLNGAVVLDLETNQSGLENELPGLVQRTVFNEIQMEIMIASGKYSEVWRANWRGEKVAVKVYVSKEEQSWMREIDIYQTVLMRHENILGFIASHIKGSGPERQTLVISEYHELGCLSDFLKNNTLKLLDLLEMIKGLSSGLHHLHNEIFGSKRKPAIAHNNINSKNILVKRDKQCCIGDFKKAVKFFSDENKTDVPHNTENTQIRYLAPEILENKLDENNFEDFKRSDVYSFSLVLWELTNRCIIEPLITESIYQLPYEEELNSNNHDLTYDALTDIVVKKKLRPVLKKEWEDHAILKIITKVIMECWTPNPSARLTILRIKKTLFKCTENSG